MSNQPISLETFQKYYDSLNPEQREAVDSIEGPVMTIAGAGTGKTQILAVRIAKILLETQIDPYNILCLTYTDSGVAAMRKRLIEIIGPTAYHIKVCTFHSFCNEILKENTEEFPSHSDAEQIDDLEKVMLFREIIDSLGVKSPIRPHGEPYLYQQDLIKRIGELKKENFSPETFHQIIQEVEQFSQKLASLIRDFCNIKGSPAEELLNQMSPDIILPQLSFSEPSRLQQTYLHYYQKVWNDYQSALTGQKRTDGPKRTAFRNTLRNFLETLEKDLPKQYELAKAYQLYQQKLTERKRYDYEDMIMLISQRFSADTNQTNGGLLRKYQEIYQYILVDEYQDTNSSQNQTVDLLGNFFSSPNIFVVGDDDQSIYRFQGASIENIINFHQRYAGEIKLVTLIRNYRSQQSILDASGASVANNQNRIANYLPQINKNLLAARGDQEGMQAQPLQLFTYETENSENFGIATKIKSLLEQGIKPQEIAVLYRNHHDADGLTELLLKLQIPFNLKAGSDILQNLEINQLIALFKLIESPNDNHLLSQALFLNFLNINTFDALKINHYYYQNRLEKDGYSLFQIFSLPDHLKNAKLNEPQRLLKFANKLAEWKEYSHNQTLNHFFENVIKESHYLEHVLNQPNRLEQLNRLNTLFKQIKELTRKKHSVDITEFLEQLKLRAENRLKLNEEPLQTNRDAIQLMTVHASKGLEFEHVFLLKCTNKIWDSTTERNKIHLPKGLIKAEITDDKLELTEDNRRLFYVAVTRAKKMIYLSHARFRSEQNKQKEDLPSLFINEIPSELITRVDTSSIENRTLEQLETIFFTAPEPDYDQQQKSFLKSLVEQHVISPTSLNNYLTCPQKFLLSNLIHLPQAKSKSLAMGTAIHYALDCYFKQYRKTRIKPPRELLTLRYKYALEKELLTDTDHKERLEIGQNILNEYFEINEENFSPDTITEFGFYGDGVNVDGIPITGKIDKIEYLAPPDSGLPKAKELVVTDFKTGNPDRGSLKVKHGEDYWRQLLFYKILCDSSPRFQKQFNNCHITAGQIEFLEKSKQKNNWQKPQLSLIPEDLEEVKNNIRFVHEQINELRFEKIDQSEPCDHCPFANLCWKK